MADPVDPPIERIKLRKYRNRRYYDSTRSLHVTLEDIYILIREGHDIEVTDSQSGEDITTKVLAQIILEYDPLKLGVFPAELLHEVIRASEPLIREFIEKYFNQALSAYIESQRHFDRYLRQALALETPAPQPADWMRMMFWPLGGGLGPDDGRRSGTLPPPVGADPSEIAQLRQLVDQLWEQVEALKRPQT